MLKRIKAQKRHCLPVPGFRGLASVLILFSLFFNIVTTVSAAQSWSSVHKILEQNADTDAIVYVLCTPNGVKKIAFDENGNPIESDDSSQDNLCLFCLPFHKVDAALLTTVEPLQTVFVPDGRTPVALNDELLLPFSVSKKSSPRAPPLFS
ncbi:hypothetical protein [Emcibacter nanhaiensis]|uniref:DUF2946 domain-containing protein n=1 Tax=Emcibacter nanhaiensis TaxID=1505037 RepID=A0A501PBM1_9PROT|nr:hypothetical protein [Emcibacter nanhaiensis]TPD57402.1 hypothetical protein FIV46_14855 [Emcibacter nanhaiensis]